MKSPEPALCLVLSTVATMAVLSLLATLSGATDIVGDTEMWGDHEDERFDVWGNLTVPVDATLTLRNVTIVFHTDGNETYGIRLDQHASLHVLDGDDDPSTPDDGSNITSTGGGWYLYDPDGIEFKVNASRLENLGRDHEEPEVGTVQGVWVVCAMVRVRDSEVLGTGGGGKVTATTVDIEGTVISRLIFSIGTMGHRASMDDISLKDVQLTVWNGNPLTLTSSVLNGSRLVCKNAVDLKIEGTLFVASYTSIDGTGIDMVDCTFRGASSRAYLNGEDLRVTGCEFTDCERGLSVGGRTRSTVERCTFTNVSEPLVLSSSDYQVANVTIVGRSTSTGIRLSGTGTCTVSNTSCRDCARGVDIGQWTGPVEFIDCSFSNLTNFGLYIRNANDVRCLSCSFAGTLYGIYGYYLLDLDLEAVGCRFEGIRYGIYITADRSSNLTYCTFVNVTYPVYQTRGAIDLRNVTMSGAGLLATGIGLSTTGGSLNVTNTTCIGYNLGIDIDRWTGPVNLSHCSFINISGNGVKLLKASEVRLASCSFINITGPVLGNFASNPVWDLVVVDSRFELFHIAIDVVNANVTAIGNTFDPGHPLEEVLCCIRIVSTLPGVDRSHVLTDNELRGADVGISIEPQPFSRSTVTLTGNRIQGCTKGLVAQDLALAILAGNVLEGCHWGLDLSRVDNLTIDGLTIANGTDGILIIDTIRVRLGHLQLKDLDGFALLESNVGTSLWTVDHDLDLNGTRAVITGEVRVNATLRLVDASINFTAQGLGSNGITVLDGGSLVLERSSISGELLHHFHLTVTGGGTLSVLDSSISNCGRYHSDGRQNGIYLQGGGHRLEGLTTEDCYKGLVLVDTSVELVDCIIRGNSTGVEAVRSHVKATGSQVSSSFIGIKAQGSLLALEGCSVYGAAYALWVESGNLSLNGSSLHASLVTIWAVVSVLELNVSTIGTEGELVHLLSTDLTMRECVVTPLRAAGGHVENGQVRMYDTSHEGTWSPAGGSAEVHQYWNHRVTVVTRWDGSPVGGAVIDVSDSLRPDAVLAQALTGADGRSEVLWLLQRRITSGGEVVPGPYTFSVDAEGIHGEAVSPGKARWEGVIEIVDLQPPELAVSWPLNGSIHRVTGITILGTVDDVGSGLVGLYASVDGAFWVQLTTEGGPWELVLELFDGDHTIRLRATDADGGETALVTNLTVDTVPPLVAFTDPSNGTAFRWPDVLVLGFIVVGGGTPVSEVRMNGEDVELNGTGHFSVRVELTREGPNPFWMVAFDQAGNRVEALLVLVLDRTPPELQLDDLPEFTREQDLVVRGSVVDPLEVSVSLNGYLVARVQNGTFETTIVLTLGQNDLRIEAVDAVGNLRTVQVSVILDTRVDGAVLFPADGAVLRKTGLFFLIETDPLAWVRVRNWTDWRQAPSNGTFWMWVALEEGEHRLIVDFRDEANNTYLVVLDVVVRPEAETEAEGVSPVLWVGLAALVAAVVVLLLRRRGGVLGGRQ